MFAPILLISFQASPLSQEPKLAEPLTLRAEAEDVGSFLSRVSEKTGVKLKASPAVKDDRIVLYATGPARDTLQKIAQFFDWTWEVERDGTLTLTQSEAQRLSEAKTREEQTLIPYLKWQAESAQGTAAPTDQDQQAFKQLVQRAIKNRQIYNPVTMTSEENSAWLQEDREINNASVRYIRLYNPASRATDTFIASLSRRDLLRLDNDGRLIGSLYAGGFHQSLPSDARQSMGDLIQKLASLPTSEKEMTPEQYAEHDLVKLGPPLRPCSPDDLLNGTIAINTEGAIVPTDPSGKIPAHVSLLNKKGMPIYSERISSRDYKPNPGLPREVPKDPLLESDIQTTPELQKVVGELVDGKRLFARFRTGTSKIHPASQMARLMIEIAVAGKVSFISDCYDTPVWSNAPKIPTQSLRYAMEAFAIHARSEWGLENGWISSRTNFWPVLRPMSIPTSTLIKMRDLLAVAPVPFDNLASAASLITLKQFYAPLVNPLFENSVRSRQTFHTLDLQYEFNFYMLKFWGLLSPLQRSQLLKGGSLSYSGLSQPEKEAIRLFLLHMDNLHIPVNDGSYATDGENLEKQILKREWPDLDIESYGALAPHDVLKNGIPSNMTITMHSYPIPAYEMQTKAGNWSYIASERALSVFLRVPSYRTDWSINEPDQMALRKTSLDRYVFTLRLGSNTTCGVQAQFGRLGTGSFFHYNDLPEAERDRLLRGPG